MPLRSQHPIDVVLNKNYDAGCRRFGHVGNRNA
jgi:hypothetical protein